MDTKDRSETVRRQPGSSGLAVALAAGIAAAVTFMGGFVIGQYQTMKAGKPNYAYTCDLDGNGIPDLVIDNGAGIPTGVLFGTKEDIYLKPTDEVRYVSADERTRRHPKGRGYYAGIEKTVLKGITPCTEPKLWERYHPGPRTVIILPDGSIEILPDKAAGNCAAGDKAPGRTTQTSESR